MEDQVAQRYPGFSRDPAGVRKSLRGATEAQEPLQEIVQRLQDSLPREGQGMSQEQTQKMRQQAQEQGRLKDQLAKLRDQLGEVGKKVPIFGPQHEQMLQQAQEGMNGAEQRLYRGEPRGAQAGEQQAIEKLSQFQDAMEKLAKQSGKGGGQGGIPMPWGEPAGDGNEDEGQVVLINQFEVPPEDAERFLEVWADDAAFMKQQPGFISTQLHRGTAGSSTFTLISVATPSSPPASTGCSRTIKIAARSPVATRPSGWPPLTMLTSITGLSPTHAAAAQLPVARNTSHAAPSSASASSSWKNILPQCGDDPQAFMPAADTPVKTGP